MRLFGRNPVAERLRSNPSSIRKIIVQEDFRDASSFRKKAKAASIVFGVVPRSKMVKMSRGVNSQGILAEVIDFEYLHMNELIEHAAKRKRILLLLDELVDPQNFGAIIRSAACLGNFSIIIPTKESVKITPAVLRVASGGENYVPICQVSNLRKAIRKAKDEGFQIVGSVIKSGELLTDVKFSHLLGIVIGSEHKGIREVIQKELDLKVTIPMSIETLSFNVAQATTILCYEATKQKKARSTKKN